MSESICGGTPRSTGEDRLSRAVHSFVCACSLLLGSALSADVVINEIHYDPDDKTVPEEFLEIYNAGDETADLSGWFFSDGIEYVFPDGTTVEPASYLVVAEDPETLTARFPIDSALGPYVGRLENDGERLVLRRADGSIADEVDYSSGFPWPLASAGKGTSMELLQPSLDNDLGGAWRASGVLDNPPSDREFLFNGEEEWHYRKATSPPSEPTDAWRQLDFVEDDTWQVGQASIGFNDDDDHTVLEDMRDNYSGVFLRKTFTIEDEDDLSRLYKIGLFVDDGAIVWINGTEVLRKNADEGEQAFDATAARAFEARWEDFLVPSPGSFLRVGTNVVAIHAMNISLTSNDFSIDARLFVPGEEDGLILAFPSPGARNSVLTKNASPQIRQVEHFPEQPTAQDVTVVSAKVTDPNGVASVRVHYQVVSPGNYIPATLPHPHTMLLSRPNEPQEPNPEFEADENWTSLAMFDDGTGGDNVAGDGIYSTILPVQPNRTIVRYRLTTADSTGAANRVPFLDDPSLNFAYFVYDGVPDYVAETRSVHPEGVGHVWPSELLNSLPVFTLITRAADMDHCIAYNSSFQIPKANEPARDKFNWEGCFVYRGKVYDHMHYRLRQANDRYGGRGKRSMRLRFNRGREIQLHDNYGQKFPTKWKTINTGKMFHNKDFGNFGLTETMNADLWNMVGVPAPWFYTFHFRVIDGEEEHPAGANGQFFGDFWGMFNAIENYDPRFVDGHDLADGNLYKLKDAIFDGNQLRRNQGRYAITTEDDFQNIRRNLRPQRHEAWLDNHVNYEKWYPYHAVVEGIRHYDFKPADTHSKNRAWYFEPFEGSQYGRLWTLPWDSDASWGPNWNSGIDYTKNAIFAAGGKPRYKQAYRNFLREFRDLLWTSEVMEQMIDDMATFVLEFSQADRDRWRGAPAQAGNQDFGPIERKVQDMKNFALTGWTHPSEPNVPAGGRARHLENLAGAEGDRTSIPETPTVTFVGPDGFPSDELRFETSDFSDPQGDPFAAMEWRLGEVTPAETPFDPTQRRVYEWETLWEAESNTFSALVDVPPTIVEADHTYRVRVRMQDQTGRWSHWSEAVEFVASAPTTVAAAETSLRITEMMYHPQDDNDLEFIELQNVGAAPLDLSDVSFVDGIEFEFSSMDDTTLGAGEYVVLASNLAVFRTRYDVTKMRIGGDYDGRLSNAGERIALRWGRGRLVLDFTFLDLWHPSTDGGGRSLAIVDPHGARDSWATPEAWQPSAQAGGSPGAPEGESTGGFQLPGDVDQDSRVTLIDGLALLRGLFTEAALPLPCSGDFTSPANRAVLDLNGNSTVGIDDGVYVLNYVFLRGAAPALGTTCTLVEGCPDQCAP